MNHLDILREVVNLPTAPFAETHVIRYIEDFVGRRDRLQIRSDQFGNLLVRYVPTCRSSRNIRPILLAAHMDHPGFIATKMINAHHVQAEFHGWVEAPYFRRGRVRFFSDGRWIPATIEKVIRCRPLTKSAKRASFSARSFGANAPPAGVVARVQTAIKPNSPGMWDLPNAMIRGHRLFARACDDLAGLAGILCMLDTLCQKRSKISCYAFFTRAEEVGFAGALAAVADRSVPRRALVVAVENSKAIAGVALGGGPVLRVGDRATVFSPSVTAYCQVVSEALATKDKAFSYQRKLMDGGTCESTVYYHYGYDATGICLPLVNYHNMNTTKNIIASESIDVRDFLNLIKWFVALVEAPSVRGFDGSHPGLGRRLDSLLKQHRWRLIHSAARMSI